MQPRQEKFHVRQNPCWVQYATDFQTAAHGLYPHFYIQHHIKNYQEHHNLLSPPDIPLYSDPIWNIFCLFHQNLKKRELCNQSPLVFENIYSVFIFPVRSMHLHHVYDSNACPEAPVVQAVYADL